MAAEARRTDARPIHAASHFSSRIDWVSMLRWKFCGYDSEKGGYAVRSRCEERLPKAGLNAAWFVMESDARQYADLMNIINPNHNSPGSR